MNAKIESIEDAEVALDEVAEFIGNWWPEHVVDEKGMTLLQKAYEKVMGSIGCRDVPEKTSGTAGARMGVPMNANSPITARLIFWPPDCEAVWLKAQFTPKMLAQMCHNGDCPLEGFVSGYDSPCPVHDCTKDENVTEKDWIRFLSTGAPIGGRDESAGNGA